MDFRELITFEEMYSDHEFRSSGKIFYTNGFTISILGGKYAFCTPRANVDIYEYERLEIAFWDSKEHSSFIDLYKHPDFKNFYKSKILNEYFDGSVYSQVPINLIQDVFDYTESIYSRILFAKEGTVKDFYKNKQRKDNDDKIIKFET